MAPSRADSTAKAMAGPVRSEAPAKTWIVAKAIVGSHARLLTNAVAGMGLSPKLRGS